MNRRPRDAAVSRGARVASANLPAAAGLVMHLHLAAAPHVRLGADHQVALAPLDAALLAWLALEGPTPRARLAALLWPDSEPEAARNALRQRLFQLKRQCGIELAVGSSLLALAPGLLHDLDEADNVLGDAPSDHGAEFSAWLRQQRERRRGRLRHSLAELADMAEHARDYEDALSHARELLALEPLSEDAHRRLIRLHYLVGDRAAALLAFDRCERVLKDEIGTRPSADTLALLGAIEQSRHLPGQALAPPPAVLRPPRLVGRARELQAARGAWRLGQVVAVVGEAGLGKTRLLQALADERADAVIAQARPGDAVVPYSAFARLLRTVVERAPGCRPIVAGGELLRLLPDTGTAPLLQASAADRPETQRLALQRAVHELLQSAATQGLGTLLFDDLHFADDASLDLLLALLRPDAGSALRWGLAQRPAEGSATLAALHEALVEDQALTTVTLQLLDEAQLQELVESLALEGVDAGALAAQLFRLTGGNPLFALETLRQGCVESRLSGEALPRPTSVARLIERRLQRLSPPALRLARCAAVAGQDFSAELAAHVLGVQALDLADAWVELDAAQVLRDGGFAHDLIHDAVLASVPPPVAQPLHAAIAGFMAARDAAPGRIAQHWDRAGRSAEAAAAFMAAAAVAHAAGRRAEEAALLADAATRYERAGNADARFEALLRRADVLGRHEQAEAALAGVAQVEAAARDDMQRLRARLVRVQAAAKRGEFEPTLALAPEGLAQARALGRVDLVLGFAVPLARTLCDLRRAAEAIALLEPLSGWIDTTATGEQRWDHASALALALDYANRLGDAVAAWQRALEIAQGARRHDLAWQTLQDLGSTQAKTGRVRLAVELGLQSRHLARAGGEPALGREFEAQVVLGHRLRDLGRYGEAVPLLEEGLAYFRKGGAISWVASIENRLGQAFVQLGQAARAQPLLASAHADSLPALAAVRLLQRADAARLFGGDALTPVREALARLPDRHDVYHRLATLFASAIVPPDEGESLATGTAAWGSAHQRHGLALAAHVRAAGCALAQDAARRARPHAEAALHLAQDFEPDSFYLPELWLVSGRVFAACGDHADAAAALQAGAAWVMRVHDAHVPAPFRDSFLHRNPVNRELLALAARSR